MKLRPFPAMLPLALLALLATAPALHAQSHDYQVLVLHPPALTGSEAFSIDDAGEVVGLGIINGQEAALIWTGAGTNFRSLNPGVGFTSEANHISGARVAGTVTPVGQPNAAQAVVWDAYSSAMTSLHPTTGFVFSSALSVDGDQVVGSGGGEATGFEENALLWTSPAPSNVVNLNPSQLGVFLSKAHGVDAVHGQQVGGGSVLQDAKIVGNTIFETIQNHALLWTGSAASAVDLNPAGFDESFAIAVSDLRQGGYAKPAGSTLKHAMLWQGDAASAIDLHPTGFSESGINSLRGNLQVGAASGPTTGNVLHAMLWQGSAASAVDLHGFLPTTSQGAPMFDGSSANGVDAFGNVVGEAHTPAGDVRAILWQRIPDLQLISFRGVWTTHGNEYVRLAVTLDGPAPSDEAITLSSSRPDLTTLPHVGTAAGTIVPSGTSQTITGISFAPVATRTIVVITATFHGQTRFATMVIVPSGLSSVNFAARSIFGGGATTATVTLDGPAPAGGALVQLTGSTPTASWSSTVPIPSGATSATFPVQTQPTFLTFYATMTATYAGVSRQDTLTVLREIPVLLYPRPLGFSLTY